MIPDMARTAFPILLALMGSGIGLQEARGDEGAVSQAPEAAAGEEPIAVDEVAEAYRVFSEARLAQLASEREAAVLTYRRAAALDPQAAAPLVAIANLSLAARDLEAAESAAAEALERDPESAAAHRILGAVYFRRLRAGNDPETAERAISALREAVRLDPEDLQSRSELARLLAASQRGEEAAAHLRELVRRAPDAFGELALLARLRLAAGDREQAFDYLLDSLRVEPRQPEAREMLDDLLRGGGIPGRSEGEALAQVAELYETAVAAYPNDPSLRLSLADALARAGRLEDAAGAFEELLAAESESEIALMGLAMVRRQQQRLEDAEDALVRLLAVNDRSVPARLALGGVFTARCEFERAAGQFEALAGLPRDSYGLARRREVLARLAQSFQRLGRHREAYEALERAVLLAGDTSDGIRYRVALVRNRLSAGAVDEAGALLGELTREHPEDPGLQTLHAQVLSAEGKPDAALVILLRLADQYPDTAGATHALLRHLVEVGNLVDAEETARQWLRKRPEDDAFRFQLAALLERQGRFEEAEAELRGVIEAVPNHDLALNYLGYMLADRNDRLDESEALIQRALAEDPYNGSYRDSLGWVQLRKGELGLAEPNLLRARQCMPDNGVVLDHLGDLYQAKGDLEEAVRFWQLALDQEGEEEIHREAIARKIEEAGNEPE